MKCNKHRDVKKHIDCDWLMKKESGVFICSDSRSQKCGEEMEINETNKECCDFFHRKKK